MKDFFQKVIILFCVIASITLGLVLLTQFDKPLMDSLGAGLSTFFEGLWTAMKIIFGLAVLIVAGVAYVRIRQMMTTHVIQDRKEGQPVRAIIHKGEMVQVVPAGLDLAQIMQLQAQQTAQMKQLWQLFGAAATSMNKVAAFMDDYVEAGDDEEEIDGGETRPQIAPPRDPSIVTMHLSDSYALPANDFLSGRKIFVGTSGSGKSNSVGAYGEELGTLGVPFVLGDTEDEYQPLCNPKWLANGILAGLNSPYSVNVENAADFGAYVLTHRLQVILNLQSYDMEEAALVMIGIIGGMREWQEALPNDQRIPSDFILEEAVTWLPQYVRESPLHGTETFAQLQGTFFNDLVRKGRKRGLGLTLVCQKIAELDNRAMQSDGKLLHRQTEDADLERYRKMGVGRDETLSLGNGEAFLYTGRVSKLRLQIRRRLSPHGADTPGIENLRKRNFDENPETSSIERKDFGQGPEPFHSNISTFRKTVDDGSNRVPEETKLAILDLYRGGTKRTKIQEQLNLNGDEYWMVKVVCNEYDRAQEA